MELIIIVQCFVMRKAVISGKEVDSFCVLSYLSDADIKKSYEIGLYDIKIRIMSNKYLNLISVFFVVNCNANELIFDLLCILRILIRRQSMSDIKRMINSLSSDVMVI